MAYCHIAHDCLVGSHTIFANNATLAGHVEIHDYAILGGFTGVHQFCRMGEGSFSAISAIILRDVPPFVMVAGNPARPRSLNREGLKRRGFDSAAIAALKRCYRSLYRQGMSLEQALAMVDTEAGECPPAARLADFIRRSERGIAPIAHPTACGNWVARLPEIVNRFHFFRNALNCWGMKAEALVAHQGLARYL